MNAKYFSRKFILTILISLMSAIAPVVYKKFDVSDMVTLSVLALLGGVGAAYGFINIKARDGGVAIVRKSEDKVE